MLIFRFLLLAIVQKTSKMRYLLGNNACIVPHKHTYPAFHLRNFEKIFSLWNSGWILTHTGHGPFTPFCPLLGPNRGQPLGFHKLESPFSKTMLCTDGREVISIAYLSLRLRWTKNCFQWCLHKLYPHIQSEKFKILCMIIRSGTRDKGNKGPNGPVSLAWFLP